MPEVVLPLLLLAAAPASASAPDRAAAPTPEKLVCKSEKATGSRLKVNRVCLTAAQWEERRQLAIKEVADRQSRVTEIR